MLFRSMIWDIKARRLELSPQVRLMFGLDTDAEVRSYRPLLRRALVSERPRLLRWMHREVLGSLWRGSCCDCPGKQRPVRFEDHMCVSRDFKIEFSCTGDTLRGEARHLRMMAQIEFDNRCHASIIFVTVQDITKEVDAAQIGSAHV